ncbi:MAG TPA: glycosyltransferase [Candidatus Binataceae bacterium]|jgi:glycosyltransferase involved in cell wall biosynthesis
MSPCPVLSVIVIGRNEGERLTRCLESVRSMRSPDGGVVEIIYVDSGSNDSSVQLAARAGAQVISVTAARPCAAVGRNTGWHLARADLVLFLDGDTIVAPDFVLDSICAFTDPAVAIVFGNRRESDPDGSIFNRVLDLDWITRSGLADYCGGDALVRRRVLEQVGGYDERLIAGEEPEMCRRIRGLGYKILHVDRAMTSHDLGIKRFSQYWRRAVRTGYAYAEVSKRYSGTEFPLWTHEAHQNVIHGGVMLAIAISAVMLSLARGSLLPLLAAVAAVAMLALRTAWRFRWKSSNLSTSLLYGLHSHLQQIPVLFGQIKYRRDQQRGIGGQLIEYKDSRLSPAPIGAQPNDPRKLVTASAPRVLLAAYHCGPGMGSVSQIGWEWYARLARRLPVTLITHVRNRDAITNAGGPVCGSEVIFIDTEWFAGPLYRIAKWLFPKSEHCVFMISLVDFFVYDNVGLRLLKRRALAGEHFDIVHAVTPVTTLAATRLHRLGAPVVIGPLNSGLASPDGFDLILRDDSAWLYRLRRLARIADMLTGSTANASVILTATRATLEGIPERSRARCFAMLENGVDLRKFKAAPWPSSELSPLRLLFVGRLVPFKGLTLLLAAIARVKAEFRVCLDVIGDGPMFPVWQAEAEKLGISALVNFRGSRQLDQVALAMRSAHVLCLPSIRESGGSVLLEAMASARPVLAVAFGGPAEIVDDAVGRAIAPGGVEAVVAGFAEALRDIVSNPEAWRDRGLEGRRRAERSFSWDAKIDRTIEVYSELAQRNHASSLVHADDGLWPKAAHG